MLLQFSPLSGIRHCLYSCDARHLEPGSLSRKVGGAKVADDKAELVIKLFGGTVRGALVEHGRGVRPGTACGPSCGHTLLRTSCVQRLLHH